MVVLGCQIEAKLYRFRPVYAGALLSIPSPSSLVSIIIFELNNAGVVGIIVESWLKVTTPDGTSNIIYSVIRNFQVLFLDGVENWLQAVGMVVMCEQSCPVLLSEAIKNYEMEIPD